MIFRRPSGSYPRAARVRRRQPPLASPHPGSPADRVARLARRRWNQLAIWGIVSLATGVMIYSWPIWVIGPWGVVLLGRTLLGREGGCRKITDASATTTGSESRWGAESSRTNCVAPVPPVTR